VGEPKARTVTILLRWLAVPSLSAPKEMDRVIGAAFSVLASARTALRDQGRRRGSARPYLPLKRGVDWHHRETGTPSHQSGPR
jgi:hypothetical protein